MSNPNEYYQRMMEQMRRQQSYQQQARQPHIDHASISEYLKLKSEQARILSERKKQEIAIKYAGEIVDVEFEIIPEGSSQ